MQIIMKVTEGIIRQGKRNENQKQICCRVFGGWTPQKGILSFGKYRFRITDVNEVGFQIWRGHAENKRAFDKIYESLCASPGLYIFEEVDFKKES